MAIHVGRHTFDQWHLLGDGMGVVEHQRPSAARSRPHAVPGPAAGLDPDKVVAQTLQLVFYLAAAGIADGNHADKRSHADGDAQNGEDTAKPVPREGYERFPKQSLEIHVGKIAKKDFNSDPVKSGKALRW